MNKPILLLIAILAFTACSSDDDNEQQPIIQSHIVEFSTGTIEDYVSVILTTTLYFEDGTESVIYSDFDPVQNVVSVEIPENTSSFELEFYIEDSSQCQMRFYGLLDNVTLHEETISQQMFQYQYSFD